jgi:UDP-N-acetylglucosamine:LPS N-acetylglucosamine transferase
MPYPYHKDMHQYLNAERLVDAGAAIVVDDLPDENDRADWLWEELEPLLKDDAQLDKMKQACEEIATKDTAQKIAGQLLVVRG